MRIAFVDLLFSWPPHGGACTDLYHTARCLQEMGQEVHLFAATCDSDRERGQFDPATLPFPSTRIPFTSRELTPQSVGQKFRAAVDAWKPDIVFVCDAFFLKPALALALQHHATVGRFYAYEAVCPRDFRLFRDGALCPNSYLTTPDKCRRCTLRGIGGEIRHMQMSPWTEEYLAARAFLPIYYKHVAQSLRSYRALVVYNEFQRQLLEAHNPNVFVISGGVDPQEFGYRERAPKTPPHKTVILMTGRAEDPSKGLDTLRRAGELLSQKRSDFEIWATLDDPGLATSWFRPIGWREHTSLAHLYHQADIGVVPSLWAEPFGMVAVEAMATGLPICVSHTGALPTLVSHGKNGFVFEPGDAAALANSLFTLLDNPALRQRMGAAARKRVESTLDWKSLVARHYPPLLQRVTI